MRHTGGGMGTRKHRQAGHPSGDARPCADWFNRQRDKARAWKARRKSKMYARVRDLFKAEGVE